MPRKSTKKHVNSCLKKTKENEETKQLTMQLNVRKLFNEVIDKIINLDMESFLKSKFNYMFNAIDGLIDDLHYEKLIYVELFLTYIKSKCIVCKIPIDKIYIVDTENVLSFEIMFADSFYYKFSYEKGEIYSKSYFIYKSTCAKEPAVHMCELNSESFESQMQACKMFGSNVNPFEL